MSKTAMPKSKAKTAYGLLSEVRRIILEEPQRYNQSLYLVYGQEALSRAFWVPPDQRPSCGTVGCVAGWVVALKGDTTLTCYSVLHEAGRILGLSDKQAAPLFAYTSVPTRREVGGVKHAEYGEKHIAKFQKRHAAQLKAKRV